MMIDSLNVPNESNSGMILTSHMKPIEVEWEDIVALFQTAFRQTFAKSKKAHFDFLPPELRVIDGARDRWYPLLLLDAAWGLLWSNDFSFASKKAFNQRKVLYDSIVSILQTNDAYQLSEIRTTCNQHNHICTSNKASSKVPSYSINEDGQVKKVVDMIKDPMAFQQAIIAAQWFPNILTVFSSPSLVPTITASTTTAMCFDPHGIHGVYSQSLASSSSIFPSMHPYSLNYSSSRSSYSFPSPFTTSSCVDVLYSKSTHDDESESSEVPNTILLQNTYNCRSDADEGDDWMLNSSPWMTLLGFRSLALSDPPAKSRNRFEMAVQHLTSPSMSSCPSLYHHELHSDGGHGYRELGELLHLVVCKVLWHQHSLRYEVPSSTASTDVQTNLFSRSSSLLSSFPFHLQSPTNTANGNILVSSNNNNNIYSGGSHQNTATKLMSDPPLMMWNTMEETLMDDFCGISSSLEESSSSHRHNPRATEDRAETKSMSMKRKRAEFAAEESKDLLIKKARPTPDQEFILFKPEYVLVKEEREELDDQNDIVWHNNHKRFCCDEDMFMINFGEETHALDNVHSIYS